MLKRLLFFVFLLSFLKGQEKLPDIQLSYLVGKDQSL